MKPQSCSHYLPFLLAFSHVVWVLFRILPFPRPIGYSKNYSCPTAWVSRGVIPLAASPCSLWIKMCKTGNLVEAWEWKFRPHYTSVFTMCIARRPNFPLIPLTRLLVLGRGKIQWIWGLEIVTLEKEGTGLVLLNLDCHVVIPKEYIQPLEPDLIVLGHCLSILISFYVLKALCSHGSMPVG